MSQPKAILGTTAEQTFGVLVTGIFCTVGAKGAATTIVSRANTALAVANALESLGNGNVAAASAAVLAAVSNNPNLDPAIALALMNALQIAFAQWQLLQTAASVLPFLSTTVEALITNFALGVSAGAAAELAKYQPVPAAA